MLNEVYAGLRWQGHGAPGRGGRSQERESRNPDDNNQEQTAHRGNPPPPFHSGCRAPHCARLRARQFEAALRSLPLPWSGPAWATGSATTSGEANTGSSRDATAWWSGGFATSSVGRARVALARGALYRTSVRSRGLTRKAVAAAR